MLRQVRVPPTSRAKVVCLEVLGVMVTGRVATILEKVSPVSLQCVNCGTVVLAGSATGVSTGTFAGLVQRQGNLGSCTKLRRIVTLLDEAA